MTEESAQPRMLPRSRPKAPPKPEVVATKVKRVAPRDPVHAEPVRVAKPKAVQREVVHEGPQRTRRRRLSQGDDMFYLPPDEIPAGSSYEWKRWSVYGEENPFYIAQMRQQGWEPVDPKRHPNWVPPGYDKPHIIKAGLILMERPMELTKEARREDLEASKQQVRDAEARLGMTAKGELTRNHPGLDNRVTKEYVRPVMVPNEPEA